MATIFLGLLWCETAQIFLARRHTTDAIIIAIVGL